MLDTENYTAEIRDRQNRRIKQVLGPHITGDEITALARILGLSKPTPELSEAEKIRIRLSEKYINADIETRRAMLRAPKRVGGGSTENQLVRRLFSPAAGAASRGLLPVSVVGYNRLELSAGYGPDPTLYTRVVLAQCIVGGMDYIADQRGIEVVETTEFNLLADAVTTAEELDSNILESGSDGVERIWIEGTKHNWVLLQKAYIDSSKARREGDWRKLHTLEGRRDDK